MNLFKFDALEQFLLEESAPLQDRPVIRRMRNDLSDLKQVYHLTHTCYVESGYASAHPSGFVALYPEFDQIPETTIWMALSHGEVVGSISCTLDGPCGFPLEKEFKSQCAAIRREGGAVATVWRLVVRKDQQNNRVIVFRLINAVFSQLLQADVETVLFAVNPKHETVYKKLLNMETVGRTLETAGLYKAPSVLLRGDREKIHLDPTAPPIERQNNPILYLLASSPY